MAAAPRVFDPLLGDTLIGIPKLEA